MFLIALVNYNNAERKQAWKLTSYWICLFISLLLSQLIILISANKYKTFLDDLDLANWRVF